MTYPRISVVTPVLNQARWLEAALRSVLDQNYPNLEYIVVDGGSTDGSIEIIKRHAHQLHYWISEPDKGMYDALNKGFAKSTGDLMLWLNSDDLLHPHALENIAGIFSTLPSVNWITGINTGFDERGRVIGAAVPRNFSKYDLLLDDFQWIQQESTAWRRSLWDMAGGSLKPELKLAGDFDLWLRFMMIEKLYRCKILIGGFRFRSGQLSVAQREKYMAEALRLTAGMRGNLNGNDKSNLTKLRLIRSIRKVLHYSYILDLNIFDRILRKLERNIHNYPGTVHVNQETCNFEIK